MVSHNEPYDPQSPTLAQLQARALASQQPSHSEPELVVTTPPPEQNPTTSEPPQTPPPVQQPTHSPSKSNPQPEQTTLTPSAIPTPTTSVASITPALNISAPNSPFPSSPASAIELETTFPTLEEAIQVFAESSVEKIKPLIINYGISDDPSERIKEAEEKAVAATVSAAEAEEKAKVEAEEETRLVAEEATKAKAAALTQGEHSNSGFVPLVLKILEELQKEQ
ncbi:uncharacterized protein LOC127104057 [Lathyrus oleraceus]|uniref:uncharacterized protein LOC127104057 n=1 Tax=Pisum sativum TaxID=3888 RepID=UPI0021D27046|nr:uncharacterized protein LOC127104057 [Pisum sativum]